MDDDVPFNRDFDCRHGEVETLGPALRRVVARNGGPFTFKGTATFIVGRGRVAVIDPGPALDDHVAALLDAVQGEEVTHILVTHTHGDHSPASAALKRATGAKTYGFGPHGSGRGFDWARVDPGADLDFVPDVALADGAEIAGDDFTFEAVHTPGHCSNHLCFQWREEKVLFPGDHVMGWSTTGVRPPDGDMLDYVSSLRRLLDRDDEIYWPTHGPPIDDPKPYVEALIRHRQLRIDQVLDCLAEGIETIPEMAAAIYEGLNEALIRASQGSTLATLVSLHRSGRVEPEGGACTLDARYRLVR